MNISPTASAILFAGLYGGPVVGIGAAALELAAKQINKESYPIARSVLETATKVIQAATAAIALLFWANFGLSLPIGLGLGVAIGGVMVLTHILNGIAENTNNETLKNIFSIADKVASCASKIINTALFAMTAYFVGLSYGINPIIGIMTGLVAGTVSLAAFLKQDPVQPKQPVEKPVVEGALV
jgi:hypothetical protein